MERFLDFSRVHSSDVDDFRHSRIRKHTAHISRDLSVMADGSVVALFSSHLVHATIYSDISTAMMGCLSDSAIAQDDILDHIERSDLSTHGQAKGRVPEIAEKEQSDELEQRLRDIKVKIQDAKVDW